VRASRWAEVVAPSRARMLGQSTQIPFRAESPGADGHPARRHALLRTTSRRRGWRREAAECGGEFDGRVGGAQETMRPRRRSIEASGASNAGQRR